MALGFSIAPVPFRTPLTDTHGVINQSIWVRWLNAVLLALNQRESAITYATRPSSPVEGMVLAFTDSTVNTWGSTIAGGGTHHVLGYYNGAHWTVIGT